MTDPIRIAVYGNPALPPADWSPERLAELKALGFTNVQVNIAWSFRPMDEILNLEDVVIVRNSPESRALPGEEETRRATLRTRSAAAKAAGFTTLFHIGLPYTGRAGFDYEPLPRCISDPTVAEDYAEALTRFAAEFPNVDDLLLYTYDQDAWLCSEFYGCDQCLGVPLHDRISRFLNAIGTAWSAARPGGRTWWEPWELSAGQTFASIPQLDPATIGLIMHGTIAEVISTMASDRFLKTAAGLAAARGVPVIGEVFLSSANEEVEPFHRLPVPLVTVRQLRALEGTHGVIGVKEYYGLVPTPYDVNLNAAAAYFADPAVSDDEVLSHVAIAFGDAADWLPEVWRLASTAYEVYPWDASWFTRELGRSEPLHELSEAIVRGQQSSATEWDTPAWRSTRGSIYMRTNNKIKEHPWLLEDVGLRFKVAGDIMRRALEIFDREFVDDGTPVSVELGRQHNDIAGFVTRVTALSSHIRESALAAMLREQRKPELVAELRALLVADLDNQRWELERRETAIGPFPEPLPLQLQERWHVDPRTDLSPIEVAIEVFDRNLDEFLATYFLPGPDVAAIGQFSLTSS